MTIYTMRFRYFFDPLCGWCYASAPALAALAERAGDRITMMPSGLFTAPRPVSTMADHAWRNDRWIMELTGQQFTEDYHRNVLLAADGVFDSTALTRTLVALGEQDRALEARFLHDAQIARYVRGEDTAKAEVVARVAATVANDAGITLGADALADRLLRDARLHMLTDDRIAQTQRDMSALGIRGVPQLVVDVDGRSHLISGEALYAGGNRLLDALSRLTVAA
ncbi:DsbA family protein [Agrobacterium sp. SORGH_AS 787]|uniref:DsbA family protein n=1 Tax=Agrobacterium sp. SORGH_AS 787 TaxID=3041775 RepID=UPI002785F441|nr:putative protein-disulfide isomerase [Rhizobium sp. SORGH_AS_0787]